MTLEEFYAIVPREQLRAALQDFPTPGYLWFESIITRQICRLRDGLGRRFDLHYAMKANPHREILRLMCQAGLGVDVASGGELAAAVAAGFPSTKIEFSGPGKTAHEIASAIDHGIGSIHVESLGELDVVC